MGECRERVMGGGGGVEKCEGKKSVITYVFIGSACCGRREV